MIGSRRARLHRDGGRSVTMTVPDARYWERLRVMLESEAPAATTSRPTERLDPVDDQPPPPPPALYSGDVA